MPSFADWLHLPAIVVDFFGKQVICSSSGGLLKIFKLAQDWSFPSHHMKGRFGIPHPRYSGRVHFNSLRANGLPQVQPTLTPGRISGKTISLQQFNKLTSTVTSAKPN
jgi:hypothetical protein